jgi:uncharacterized membrane protein YozB (DUF420 family)
MDYYQLVAAINLIVQIVVLVLLLGGYWLKQMKKFRQHGITMLTAVILHMIMVLAVMLPSFVLGVIPLILANSSAVVTIVVPLHGIMGIIAAVLGVWIVTQWRLHASLQYCGGSTPKKKLMRLTLIVWLIALLLGVLLYLHFYTAVLPLQ